MNGRDSELQELRQALDEAQAGRGRLFLVSGRVDRREARDLAGAQRDRRRRGNRLNFSGWVPDNVAFAKIAGPRIWMRVSTDPDGIKLELVYLPG